MRFSRQNFNVCVRIFEIFTKLFYEDLYEKWKNSYSEQFLQWYFHIFFRWIESGECGRWEQADETFE